MNKREGLREPGRGSSLWCHFLSPLSDTATIVPRLRNPKRGDLCIRPYQQSVHKVCGDLVELEGPDSCAASPKRRLGEASLERSEGVWRQKPGPRPVGAWRAALDSPWPVTRVPKLPLVPQHLSARRPSPTYRDQCPERPPVTRAFVLLLTHCPVLSSLSRMSGAEDEMTHDGPRTNGEVPRTTATPSRTAPILPDICYTLRRKVTAFLEQPSDDQLARDTQAQARVAMGVIKEALQSYTYHPPPHHASYPQTNPPTATIKSRSPTTAAKTASSSSSSSSPASRPPRSPHRRPNPPPHPRSPSPRNASKQSTSRRPTPSRKSRPSSPPRPKPTTSTSSATRCPCAPRSRRTSATGRRCAPCSWARGGRIRTANFWSILARRMGTGRGL